MALQPPPLTDRSGTSRDAAYLRVCSFTPLRSADGKTVEIADVRHQAFGSKALMDIGAGQITLTTLEGKPLPKRMRLRHSLGKWTCSHCAAEVEDYEQPAACPECEAAWEEPGEEKDYVQARAPQNMLSDALLQKLDELWPLVEAAFAAQVDVLDGSTPVIEPKLAVTAVPLEK